MLSLKASKSSFNLNDFFFLFFLSGMCKGILFVKRRYRHV